MGIVGIPVDSGDGPIHAVNRDEGKAVRIDFLGNFRIDICAAINWSWLGVSTP